MTHRITGRDENGVPTYVHINDGFMEISRPYDKDQDGWIDEQLVMSDFPLVEAAMDIRTLILEVNYLRRENYRLQQCVDERVR